jgi:NAD(P)-dependent dehydrogenase (short-subunit alcohol dehydrogenase family)
VKLTRTQPSVRGSVVLITGGARGIGAATAALFADHGARVWIGDVDSDACLDPINRQAGL